MKNTGKNIKTGLFVVAATVFFIMGLYLVGSKRNLFGSTIHISAWFYNVNGLMEGNNVRFCGIDVGTVDRVVIENDSSVRVIMVIDQNVRKFITKNSIAAIGTDGLMGNKLVNINPATDPDFPVEEGDIILSRKPIETDEMLRTLNATNENISIITENLKTITQKINSRNTLWSILMDTVVADNVKQSVVSIRNASGSAATATDRLNILVENIRTGRGPAGTILSDTIIPGRLRDAADQLAGAAQTTTKISDDLSGITGKMSRGEGSVGSLLMDTVFVYNLNQTVINLNKSAQSFDENMQALKSNFLFRRYFKKKAKEKKQK